MAHHRGCPTRWDRWFPGVLGFSGDFGGIENARSIRNVGCIRELQKRVLHDGTYRTFGTFGVARVAKWGFGSKQPRLRCVGFVHSATRGLQNWVLGLCIFVSYVLYVLYVVNSKRRKRFQQGFTKNRSTQDKGIWLEPGLSHVTWLHYDATMCLPCLVCSVLPVLHFLRFGLFVL